MLTNLQKHARYKQSYGHNELFWGLGIEEETYLQFDKPIYVATPIIRTAHKAERYSVRYFDNYKSAYQEYINQLFPDASGCLPLPFFLNSHVFQKCDRNGHHKTTYEKVPKPTPEFLGQTIQELLFQHSTPLFKGHEVWYTFDGDTVEFMTQNFYKAGVKGVIQELLNYKDLFLQEVQRVFYQYKIHIEKGHVVYPPKNPGFVVHLTNPSNICVFNNGTYHINITLPSWLNHSGELMYPDLFREQHRAFARLIQWMEPLLLLAYGTPDPLSKIHNSFSKISQRGSMSRYIGIGTFDTVAMPEGKRNTIPIADIPGSEQEGWWYASYHEESGYTQLQEIGLDINYKKHHCHGLELRFFDWFPETELEEVLHTLLCLAQASLLLPLASPAIASSSWNECVKGVHEEGKQYIPSLQLLASFEKVLRIPVLELEGQSIQKVWNWIMKELHNKYQKGALLQVFK